MALLPKTPFSGIFGRLFRPLWGALGPPFLKPLSSTVKRRGWRVPPLASSSSSGGDPLLVEIPQGDPLLVEILFSLPISQAHSPGTRQAPGHTAHQDQLLAPFSHLNPAGSELRPRIAPLPLQRLIVVNLLGVSRTLLQECATPLMAWKHKAPRASAGFPQAPFPGRWGT